MVEAGGGIRGLLVLQRGRSGEEERADEERDVRRGRSDEVDVGQEGTRARSTSTRWRRAPRSTNRGRGAPTTSSRDRRPRSCGPLASPRRTSCRRLGELRPGDERPRAGSVFPRREPVSDGPVPGAGHPGHRRRAALTDRRRVGDWPQPACSHDLEGQASGRPVGPSTCRPWRWRSWSGRRPRGGRRRPGRERTRPASWTSRCSRGRLRPLDTRRRRPPPEPMKRTSKLLFARRCSDGPVPAGKRRSTAVRSGPIWASPATTATPATAPIEQRQRSDHHRVAVGEVRAVAGEGSRRACDDLGVDAGEGQGPVALVTPGAPRDGHGRVPARPSRRSRSLCGADPLGDAGEEPERRGGCPAGEPALVRT